MKKLLLLVIFLTVLVSCDNERFVQDDVKKETSNEEIADFCVKLDSLNSVYSEANTTRGLVSDYVVSAVADNVGKFVGGKIFSWAGSAIGAASGNPVVAVGGYLIGRKFGGAACSAVASMGAAWLWSHRKTRATVNSSLVLDKNYVVPIENPDSLSDGELHNLILAEFLKNLDKYIMSDGNLDYALMLEDAYKYENEAAPFKEYATYKSVCEPKALEQIRRVVTSSEFLEESDNKEFLNDVYEKLIPEIKMQRQEFDKANILNEKVISTYIELNDAMAKKYSKEIDKAIDASLSDPNLKYELKSSNNLLLNSTTIWKNVK